MRKALLKLGLEYLSCFTYVGHLDPCYIKARMACGTAMRSSRVLKRGKRHSLSDQQTR